MFLQDPFIIISQLSGNSKIQIYKSEVCERTSEPEWCCFELPISNLLHNETIIVECYDFDALLKNDLIGRFEVTLTIYSVFGS
jgi:Ca2+-dependent lipid-binding protein